MREAIINASGFYEAMVSALGGRRRRPRPRRVLESRAGAGIQQPPPFRGAPGTPAPDPGPRRRQTMPDEPIDATGPGLTDTNNPRPRRGGGGPGGGGFPRTRPAGKGGDGVAADVPIGFPDATGSKPPRGAVDIVNEIRWGDRFNPTGRGAGAGGGAASTSIASKGTTGVAAATAAAAIMHTQPPGGGGGMGRLHGAGVAGF